MRGNLNYNYNVQREKDRQIAQSEENERAKGTELKGETMSREAIDNDGG